MSIPIFHDNPAYQESCRFIVEGHTLLTQGKSTLPKSDEEQDRMERAWASLSEAEAERLWGLAADLDMLLDKEVFQPLDSTERSPEQLGARLKAAIANDNWDGALVLLRYGPPFLTRDQIALLRGRAWQNLGHDDVALLFFDYAGKLNPRNATTQLHELHTLLKLGRVEEARKRSEDYVVAADDGAGLSFAPTGAAPQ